MKEHPQHLVIDATDAKSFDTATLLDFLLSVTRCPGVDRNQGEWTATLLLNVPRAPN